MSETPSSWEDMLRALRPVNVPRFPLGGSMPRLVQLVAPPRVPVQSLVDSLFAILEEIDGMDDERLEKHRDRLEAAEEDLLGVIQVGECERVSTPGLDNQWCGRDTLPGSRFCTRHQESGR